MCARQWQTRNCTNKKQCSRQLQCEVPGGVGNVVNSSLFNNSSLSTLSSTSPAVQGGVQPGGSLGGRRGVGGGGGGVGGQGTFPSTCHILHYHMVLHSEGTSHNNNDHKDPEQGFRLRSHAFGLCNNRTVGFAHNFVAGLTCCPAFAHEVNIYCRPKEPGRTFWPSMKGMTSSTQLHT